MDASKMNEIQIPQAWVNGLGAALVGLGLWLMKKYAAKIDKLSDAQAGFVTRGEFTAALAEIDARVQVRHSENITAVGAIGSRLDLLNSTLLTQALKK